MIVVSDSSPIISLLKVARLSLLQEVFGSVFVPKAVYSEITDNALYSNELRAIQNSDFIKVVEVSDAKAVELMQKVSGLDRGESEAIVLCQEHDADYLLIDEKRGRRVAKELKINLTGILGVLILAFRKSIVSYEEVSAIMDGMDSQGIYISPSLKQEILRLIS